MPIAHAEVNAMHVSKKRHEGYPMLVSDDSKVANFNAVPMVDISVYKKVVGIVDVLPTDHFVTS